MAINELQLPPIINVPQTDFYSQLGGIGQDLGAMRQRLQAPGLVADAFGAQPSAPAPQPSGPTLGSLGQAQPAAASSAVPRGLRNNNPLNIEAGGFTQSQPGFTGSDGRFAQFASLDQGINAADNLLASYGKHGINTVGAVVNRWAPPGENDSRAYASTVAGHLGVDQNTQLDMSSPAVRRSLIGAMAQVELGRPLPTSAVQAAPQPTAQGQGAIAPLAFNGTPVDQQSIPPNAQPAQYRPQGQGAPGGLPQPAMPGLSPEMAQKVGAMLANPYTAKLGEALLAKYAAPSYGFQTLPDGTIIRTDALRGTVQPVYQSTKPQFSVIAKDQYGNDVHGFVDATTRQVYDLQGRPIDPNAMPNAQGGTQQPTNDLHGDDFLKTLNAGQAATVKGIVEGRIPYPTGFLMKTPYGQWLQNAIGQYEPGVDANVIAQRKKLQTDLSASSPNSMGGILSNGKSAFEHLAELSDKAVGLDSANGPNMPGGGMIAHAENYVGSALGTSATKAKIGAFSQNALKYGQESTKFYAGTGGGEAERMNALKSLNPETSSGQEQAAFLENEKGLMLDRLQQKEAQVRSVMGDAYLAQHPIVTPELQQTISKIDANIARLRGQATAPASTQTAAQSPTKPSAPTFASPQDVYAAMKAGKLKSGDQFTTPDGQLRTVK